LRQIHPYPEVLFEDSYGASRDKEVIEYALSHSLSPTMIAEYMTMLPDKKILQTKTRYLCRLRIELEKKSPDNFQTRLLSAPGEIDSSNKFAVFFYFPSCFPQTSIV
jgi:hypothetical protein